VLSRDARFLYTGTKRSPRVTRTDLTSMSLTTSATLTTTAGIGSVSDVFFSEDGTRLFAVLQDGKHVRGGAGTGAQCGGGGTLIVTPHAMSTHPGAVRRTGGIAHGVAAGPVILVELNPTTLEEVRRVDLGLTGFLSVGEAVAGNRAAVLDSTGHVAFVDLTTFTLVDTDGATSGVQPLALVGTGEEMMTTSADRTELTVALAVPTGYRLDTIDTETFAITSVDITAIDRGRKANGLHRTRDGKIYFLYFNDTKGAAGGVLVTIEGTQQTSTDLPDPRNNGIAFTSDETRYFLTDTETTVRLFERATGTELDTDGDAGNGVTPMTIEAPSPSHNLALVTPF
jgi:hypothetical protein